MLPIALINTVLVILTFNFYLFWAKSNVRSYLWRTTILQGRSLTYSGDGKVLACGLIVTVAVFLMIFGYPALVMISALNIDPELLSVPNLGTLGSIVMAALVPVVISSVTLLLVIAPQVETSPLSIGISATVLYLGIVSFSTLSRYLTYRYLLRHTHWKGRSGNVAGTPVGYTLRMFLPELSNGLTLGWSAPWRFMRRFALLLDGATFAGQSISFTSTSKPVYRPFAISWVLIATLSVVLNAVSNRLDPDSALFPIHLSLIGVGFFVGMVLAMAYYNARLFAHVADSIRIDGVRLSFKASWWDLTLLYFTNLTMNLLSVGLSYYFSRMRIARFVARHLEIHGNIPLPSGCDCESEPNELLGEGAEILAGTSYF